MSNRQRGDDLNPDGNADMCEKDVNTMREKALSASVPETVSGVSSREETLGSIVIEILRAGESVTRRTVCLKLAARLSKTDDPIVEAHLGDLIGLLLPSCRNDE